MNIDFDVQVKKQINQLELEVSALEDQIKPIQEKIVVVRKKIDQLRGYLSINNTANNNLVSTPVRLCRDVFALPNKKTSLGDTIVSILKESGSPIHYNEIIEKVEAKGIEIKGKNKKATMTAHLSIDDRICRFSRGIYGLKEWKTENEAQVNTV